MEREIKILAIPKDAVISDTNKISLTKNGIVLVRTENPLGVKLITPSDGLDVLPANDFIWAALDALSMTSTAAYSEPDANKLRSRFISNLAVAAKKNKESAPPTNK